ncbi:MAG: capsule biosynthesis protein [Sulfuricurvum sp.]
MNLSLKSNKSYQLIVLIPLVIAIIYYMMFAANRYVSETLVNVLHTNEASSNALSGLASLVGVNASSREDTILLREYIYSLDMLKILDKKISLKVLFKQQKKDPFYRLYDWMPQELYLWYYRNRVEVTYDDTTGLLKIRAEGFTPEQSHLLTSAIIQESERFINELSHNMSRQQLAFAEEELRKAKERYSNAKNKLMDFQNRHGMFDPVAQAQAKAGLTTEFDADLAHKEAELKTMLSYLNDNAPQVIALQAEINAIKSQMKKESSEIASTSGKPMNALAATFQNLTIDYGFAEDSYKFALTAVEKSRINANQKIKYLAIVQSPTLPEMAEYPRRLYNIITLFFILSLVYGIGQMLKATIEDHKY